MDHKKWEIAEPGTRRPASRGDCAAARLPRLPRVMQRDTRFLIESAWFHSSFSRSARSTYP